MSCQKCGHKREGAVQPHNYGCPESSAARALREHARNLVAPDFAGSLCDFGGCSNPKRPQGKGPRPKYCDEHSTPKSRKE